VLQYVVISLSFLALELEIIVFTAIFRIAIMPEYSPTAPNLKPSGPKTINLAAGETIEKPSW
jgi:hypothetical protein